MTHFCEFYAKFLQWELRDFLRFMHFEFSFLAKLRVARVGNSQIEQPQSMRKPPVLVEPGILPKVKLLAEPTAFVEAVQRPEISS